MTDPGLPAVDRIDRGRRSEPKQRLFRAAICVALESGFGKVTLNAIARQAGISKGGLLHHFATKNDLVRAMLEHYAGSAADRRLPGLDVDPLAVAALVAAAEDILLLEAISTRLDIRICDFADSGEVKLALAVGLARRLRLCGGGENTAA